MPTIFLEQISKSKIGLFFFYYFIAFVLLFLSMSSALWLESAHHDNTRYFKGEISEIYKSNCLNDSQYSWLKLIGRPVTAEIECKVFKNTKTFSDLKKIRLIVVGILALGSTFLGLILYRNGINLFVSLPISVSIFTLPGMQNAVLMTNIPNVITPAFALFSFYILSQVKNFNIRSLLMTSVAVALLVISGLTYPAMSFIFFLGWIVRSFTASNDSSDSALKKAIFEFTIFIFSMVLALVLSRALLDSSLAERLINLTDNFKVDLSPTSLILKIPFILTAGFPLASSFWFMESDYKFIFFVTIALLVGLLCLRSKLADTTRACRVASISLVLISIALACAPLGLTKSPVLHQRVLFVLEASLLLGVLLSIYLMLENYLPNSKGRLSLRYLIPFYTALAIGLFHSNYSVTLSAWATNLEMNFVRIKYAEFNGIPRRIHLVRSENNNTGFNGRPSLTDEFNRKTTDYQQDITDFLRLSLYGSHLTANERKLTYCDPSTTDCEMVVPQDNIIISYSDYKTPFCKTPGMLLVDMNVLVTATNTGKPKLASIEEMASCATGKFRVFAKSLPGEQYFASKAFDKSVSVNDFWETSIKEPVVLDIDYSQPEILTGYNFTGGEGSTRMPTSWSLYGFDKLGNSKLLDQKTAQRSFERNESRNYTIMNSSPYQKYRFIFHKAGTENILRIYEIELQSK